MVYAFEKKGAPTARADDFQAQTQGNFQFASSDLSPQMPYNDSALNGALARLHWISALLR